MEKDQSEKENKQVCDSYDMTNMYSRNVQKFERHLSKDEIK